MSYDPTEGCRECGTVDYVHASDCQRAKRHGAPTTPPTDRITQTAARDAVWMLGEPMIDWAVGVLGGMPPGGDYEAKQGHAVEVLLQVVPPAVRDAYKLAVERGAFHHIGPRRQS